MPRDIGVYLDDILDAIGQIRTYVVGYDTDRFAQDRKTQDAVIRNLEVIGEAARNLPEDARPTEIDWRKLTGLRNILIHEYFGVSLPIVWDIVETKLDTLEVVVRGMLDRLDDAIEGSE